MTGVGLDEDLFESAVDTVPCRTILVVGVAVALVATVSQWAVVSGVGLWIRPVGFAVVAAAVVAGRPARWGSAAALLLVGTALTGWAIGVAWAVAAFVTVAVSTRLWARDEEHDEGWGPWTVRYTIVAVTGVLVFAATSSWLLDVFGRAAFSLAVVPTLAANLPLAVLGAPFVRLALERTGGMQESPVRPLTTTTRAAVVLVALCWTIAGYVGSFLFRIVEQVPRGSLERRFSTAVSEFVGLWGRQGTHAQLLLGLVALAVIGLLLRR